MSRDFFAQLPVWCQAASSRAKCLRMARAQLGLSRPRLAKDAPVALSTLARFEDERVDAIEPAVLYALVKWYEERGIVFGDSDVPLVTEAR